MRDLFEHYKQVFQRYKHVAPQTLAQEMQRIGVLDQHLPPTSSFYVLTDLATQTYQYITQNVIYVLGYPPEYFYTQGFEKFFNLLHKEDAILWVEMIDELLQVYAGAASKYAKTQVDLQYSYRVQMPSGRYRAIIEHQMPLHLTEDSNSLLLLGHVTVLSGEDLPQNSVVQGSIRILNQSKQYETLFFRNYSQQKRLSTLTPREKELIQWLKVGTSSYDIADILHISPHTVNRHRKNIIRKLGLGSTKELEFWEV